MKTAPQTALILLASLGLAACATTPVDTTAMTPPAPVAAPEQAPADINTLFDSYDEAQLATSPLTKAYRGIRDEDYGEWGDFTDAAQVREEAMLQSYADRMRAGYEVASLPEKDALSYRLFEAVAQRSASLFPYRDYGYIFDQMNGAQSQLPAFLINIHAVQNVDHARDYVSRIEGLGGVMDTLTAQSRDQADEGIMPPDWVYPYVISDIRNLLEAGEDSAVLEDFRDKVDALDGVDADTKDGLKADATTAWTTSAVPAYRRLLAEMERQQAMAPTDDGIWRFPEGEAYYAALLKNYTTTDLTADQIHRIGLQNVERIHNEMREIMDRVGFEGTLQDFFEFTRTDDRFYYDTREAYLADAQEKLDAMEAKLPEFFATLPKAALRVKPVEAFREQSAGKAFYQSPAPDGSRPGTYYVNLYNLKDMSKNELEALAYHEGLPGHHLQRSIQTELGDVPPFRRFGGVTAYTEGWGLYSEELGKDMGFYTDPYADFGRLQMELWRACRLVVDTGIHDKRWSRERAIQYLSDNTPNPDGDIRKAIERYIVYPGQATAYMIGKLKIMELREAARAELREDFDIRAFHDVVLLPGPVPLDILEENVEAWVASEKAS
ncbi:DUF885 domain-containing protein [Alteriqipengyuania lutimaris]|uniref:DUF885 domain-containing protein n=1 Tax=Alteriqipengyuania lutimaris TaxID=1538146 RepID=A0A395LQ18_9SPHN|nr:DUF885 domain-containing protein [Alteriqipengyuania lutimaris]MBB3034293.1 uncharacterized protein (DUF885 family) [Alteriqipengyuania lutimaris]RDS76800.1 DUF885 domain-containing protein [Alteriqipengyuania lutimaris]